MSKPATFFYLSVLCLALAAAHGQEVRPSDAVRVIVNEETRFAEHARDHGTRAAFLEFLADDAVMFDPAPVKGKELWEKRAPDNSSLIWSAAFAAVARGTDIGYDTGPWQWRKDKAAAEPDAFGHFVSIWKRQADGRWKVALDYGIDHPHLPAEPGQAQMSYSDDGLNETVDVKAARKAAQEARRLFVEQAKSDAPGAILAVAEPEIRVYRQGVLPAVGRESAGVLLGTRKGKLTLSSLGGGISRTGDLGYDFGKYTLSQSGKTEAGHYLQIWRTDATGAWKLALDLQRPLPAEPQKKRKR